MITDVFGGDMFSSEYAGATLVVTVNCQGIMGKGVAKTFREKFPRDAEEYIYYAKSNVLDPGRPFQFNHYSIFFPTKNRWQNPSRISWIKQGVPMLKDMVVPSYMCIPPLGCGNGGLNWKEVYSYNC